MIRAIHQRYRHYRALREAKLLVDDTFYTSTYPDTVGYPGGSARHYFDYGWQEGRNPCAAFNTSHYLVSNPDVARSGVNPLYHYVRYGREEGRVPISVADENAQLENSTTAGIDIEAEVDPAYYLARNPDVAQAGHDAVEHYVKWGLAENRQPNINFDVEFYEKISRERRREDQGVHRHYLAEGRAVGLPKSPFSAGAQEFDRFCGLHGWDPSEVEEDLDGRREDLVNRLLLGELGAQLAKLSRIDPLVMGSYDAALGFQYSPFRSSAGLSKISAIMELMAGAEWCQTDAVIVLPWSRMGGASKLAGLACKVLAERFGTDRIIVLHTAEARFDYSHWFPSGIKVVDFFSSVKGLSSDAANRVLFEFLRAVQTKILLNINSKVCWDVMEEYGQSLRESCKLVSYMFCHEVDARGHKVGYPIKNYHRGLPFLDAVLVDSHALRDELAERYCLFDMSLSRLHVLPTPTDPELPHVVASNRSEQWRHNVYWAGRFVCQKRLDILREVAYRMPDVNFHVWGGYDWRGSRPANLHLRGLYRRITELPLEDCDAWLYTSGWDGVPNVLIEVATLGIPIVGSVVGGTGEVLLANMSVPILDVDNVEAYTNGLQHVLADLPAARDRSARLRAHVLETRDPEVYSRVFNEVLDLIDVCR